jgi:hypothetical protein
MHYSTLNIAGAPETVTERAKGSSHETIIIEKETND